MSANLVRLRKRAAELEQKKQFDRALEVYVQILDEGGKDLDDEDVPLFNRVGDMLMRKGSVTEALGYYERAVDMYAERGYLNNAIALCSKILRQSPGRAAVYYKLARISARKGFKSDARKNFLEYADRMQKLGMADEAFRALKEFASLYPDQDDVRLVLAELLSKENRKGEALEQLQSLYEKLQSEGRAAEARATVDRMRAIDPSVTPREGAQTLTPSASDLVFLDLSDAEGTTPSSAQAQPASARATVPTPVPALTGLSITFFPDEAEAPRPEGFESTAVEAEPAETAPVTRSLTPLGAELVVEPAATSGPPSQADLETVAPVEAAEPVALERVEEVLERLLPEPGEAEAPDDGPRPATPLSSFEFAELDLDDAAQGHEAREHDLTLPGELPATPEEVEAVEESAPGPAADTRTPLEVAAVIPEATPAATEVVAQAPSPASDAAAEDARTAAEEAAALAADVAAREAAQVTLPATWQPSPSPMVVHNETADDEEAAASLDALLEEATAPRSSEAIPDDFLAMPPSFGASTATDDEHAFPPLVGLDDEEIAPVEPAVPDEVVVSHDAPATPATPAEPAPRVPTPRTTISIGSAESHLRSRLELDPENWELRRQLGEALLDNGDRDGGLYELELAMAGFEVRGDLDRAQEVVDEILGVAPGSVPHHQKRVEFAVRSRDRARLTNSYLELADALFRTGAADKAVAVYSRVLELDPSNERGEFALATLAPDELARRRGVPARPERWTDELAAIGGNGSTRAEPRAATSDPTLPDEETSAEPGPTQDSPATPRVRFQSIELPVPEWGEGVPLRPAASAAPVREVPPAGVEGPQREWSSIAEPEREQEESSRFAPAFQDEPDDESASVSLAEGPPEAPAIEPRSPTPVPVPTTRSATPLSGSEPTIPTPWSVPAPRPVTPLSAPRSPTPAGIPTRPSTPLSVPTTRTPTPQPVPVVDSDSPLSGADSDFDLGEWLRRTEPARSTRMQVEDPKPTGDEQADFEEMLRRFKRGVAENVEAEDYEAHYDLGVAFKEMGLIDEAIAQFQKSLRDPSQRVRSYEALGQCFVEKEQYPIAAALLQRATEVPGTDDQQLVGVLYLLGFATEHLGRPADALPYYLRVFAVDIEFRDIAERVAALGKLNT